jgi:hypothetical protein
VSFDLDAEFATGNVERLIDATASAVDDHDVTAIPLNQAVQNVGRKIATHPESVPRDENPHRGQFNIPVNG